MLARRSRCLLALLLFAAAIPIPAHSAVKFGTPCNKVGSTTVSGDKKFTCIKSGKKLIWNKGVLAAKPVTKTEPKPTPSPSAASLPIQTSTPRKYPAWETPVDKAEISGASRNNFKTWLASQPLGNEKIAISINSDIDPKNVDYLTSVMRIASRTLLQRENQITHMYISVGDSWAISQVKRDFPELAGWTGTNVCYIPNPYAACAWPNYGIVFFIASSVSDWNYPNQGILQSGAHEYFHLVQDVLLRNSIGLSTGSIASKIPAWFYEGSATFIGTAFADESGLATWTDLRSNEVSAYISGRGTNEPLSSFQENALDRPQPEGQSHRPYGIGFLACEYIVASVGLENFLYIFKQLGSGKSFDESFVASTGLNLVEFYSKFDSMRTQIGFFPVK
jgi:hypothetical protein